MVDTDILTIGPVSGILLISTGMNKPVLKGTLHPFALSFVLLETKSYFFPHHFPQRWEISVFTANTSFFKLCHMTILTSFKEGSVKSSGSGETTITDFSLSRRHQNRNVCYTFDYKYDRLSIQIKM